MGHIISIHSYRGGTGKSNLTANLAFLAACRGKRVAVLDTDLQSPGVHVVLGLDKGRLTHTLTDYLFGRCDLEEAAYDLSSDLGISGAGALFLLPSSMSVESIVRIVSEGYDVGKLNDQFGNLMQELSLDLLMLDTHPGLNRETMLSTAISDVLLLIIRPDSQDFHGTAVLLEVSERLGVPNVFMLANKVPTAMRREDVIEKIERGFGKPVVGLLPLSESIAVLGSQGLFVREHGSDLIGNELSATLDQLLASLDGAGA